MFQNGFYVSIRKTDKREVSEDVHDLPPDNGPFEEYRVADYLGCPSEWSKDGMFVPVHESQPLWFDFRGNVESACLASVQRINPATGETADLGGGLSKDPLQNYLKLPDQLWLDGYSKEGKVYQFVVVTEGKGDAVNEVLLPKHMQDSHAMGFAFYLPKPRPKSGFSPCRGLTKTVTVPEFTLPRGRGGGKQSSAGSVNSDDLILPASADNSRFTQNRVADNYNCTGRLSAGDEGLTTCDFASYDYDRADSIATGAVVAAGGDDVNRLDEVNTCFLAATAEIDTSNMDQASMGAGGRIGQDIIYDNNTVEYYQEKPVAILTIYLALPEMFEAITKKGRRQDATRKDKYKTSGHVGGVAVPLV